MQQVIDELLKKENSERFMQNVVRDKRRETQKYEDGRYKMDRVI